MIAIVTTMIAAGAATAALALAGMVLDLRLELRAMRKEFEEEAAWADEYARQAVVAQTELARVRQEYAVLNWVYEGTNMMQLGAAWRAGVRVGKGRVGA